VGPLCMHVLTFLCRESAAATFLLPGYQHDHIIQQRSCSFCHSRWPWQGHGAQARLAGRSSLYMTGSWVQKTAPQQLLASNHISLHVTMSPPMTAASTL